MATIPRIDPDHGRIAAVKYVSRREGIDILDRQARKYLGMSGEALVRWYRAGEIEEADSSEVLRVSMLIPLADR